MRKYLSGSANTGKKILNNMNIFSYDFLEKNEIQDESTLYSFSWNYDCQRGKIAIIVKNSKISNDSWINTDNDSPHPFCRPLGMYNDPTLDGVFKIMMSSRHNR